MKLIIKRIVHHKKNTNSYHTDTLYIPFIKLTKKCKSLSTHLFGKAEGKQIHMCDLKNANISRPCCAIGTMQQNYIGTYACLSSRNLSQR